MLRRRFILGGLCLTACRPGKPSAAPADYEGALVSTGILEQQWSPFMARQRVTAHHGDRTEGFEGVLQLAEGKLLLVGLTPFGTKAFVLEQRDLDVQLQMPMPIELPFPPRYILLDVHRTLFMGLPDPPYPDGEHEDTRAGERIVEVWKGGQLLERRFERLDESPAGAIRITYPEGMRPRAIPPRAELHNPWFGYWLEVDTLGVTPLGPSS